MTPVHRHQRLTERDLVALADGSLPAARRARVERAVAASPELQASVAVQRRALSAISDAAGEPAPGALRARLALAHAPSPRRAAARRPARGFATVAVTLAGLAIVAVLMVGGGASGGATVADAAVLGTRAPLVAAPARPGDRVLLPRLRAAGLPYPYWEDRFGFKTVGLRSDRIAGRMATTVFYGRAGRQVAYTIVSGARLPAGASTHSLTRNGVMLGSFTAHGRLIVTWLRRGHTCVLTATDTPLPLLLRLASWRGSGEIPY